MLVVQLPAFHQLLELKQTNASFIKKKLNAHMWNMLIAFQNLIGNHF